MTRTTIHRIAVVGCGSISRFHFSSYAAHADRVKVAAACDPLSERTAWARETFGVENTFTSVDEMLEFDGWDTAVVCTPSNVRGGTIAKLAEAGKHLLVEKPLADNYAEASQAVAACDRAGVRLAVNQNFRDVYPFGIGRSLIEDGRIGDVLGIAHREVRFRHDAGWRLELERYALAVMGVHWLDGFRVLLNRNATWITCRTYSSPAIDCRGETDAFVQIQFGNVPVAYVQSFSSGLGQTDTLVFGETGTLRLDYDRAEVVKPDGGRDLVENPYAGERRNESIFRSLDRLLVAIDEGGEPSNSGHDNLETIALLDAAYRSAAEGSPLNLEGVSQ